jgi:hypothetical protein
VRTGLAALFKTFDLYENVKLEFRTEAFNVLNTAQFVAPNTTLSLSACPAGAACFLAEVRASRTHRRPLRTTTGFEDREDHRNPSTSLAGSNQRIMLIAYYAIQQGVVDWPLQQQ